MDDAARQKLYELINDHGVDVSKDIYRCKGLLKDYCAGYPKEMNVLISALQLEIPNALTASKNSSPQNNLLTRLTKQLYDNIGVREELAYWAVESWAIALGVDAQKKVTQMIGTVLRDRYKILEQFGSGGFSDVYLTEDINISRKCIVKRLKPKITDPKELEDFLPKAREMFEKEAEQLQKLGDSSSQIPTLYDFFQEGADFYLVMEYIEGHDLRQEIVEGVNMAEKTVLQLLKDVLEALKTVHEKGIVHRDVKPDNIRRRDSDNKIVLIDFGAIKEVASQRISQNKGYASKTISIGTEEYMPPEQAAGRPKLSSDIYALGAMVIEALTGIPPSKIHRDSRDQFEWRSEAPHITPAFADYVDKMVRQEFSQRFENATVALAGLEKVGSNVYVPPTVREESRQRDQTSVSYDQGHSNSKLWIWIGVAALGLIISGFALSNVFSSKNPTVVTNQTSPSTPPTANPSSTIPTPVATTTAISSTTTPTPVPTPKVGEYLKDDSVWKWYQRGLVLCYDYQSDGTCIQVRYPSGFGNDNGFIQQFTILKDGSKMVSSQKVTRRSGGYICTTITRQFYDSISFFRAKTNTAWIEKADEGVEIDIKNKIIEDMKRSNAQMIGQEFCLRYYVTKIDEGKVTQVQEHMYIDGIRQGRVSDYLIYFFKPDDAKTYLRLRPQN